MAARGDLPRGSLMVSAADAPKPSLHVLLAYLQAWAPRRPWRVEFAGAACAPKFTHQLAAAYTMAYKHCLKWLSTADVPKVVVCSGSSQKAAISACFHHCTSGYMSSCRDQRLKWPCHPPSCILLRALICHQLPYPDFERQRAYAAARLHQRKLLLQQLQALSACSG